MQIDIIQKVEINEIYQMDKFTQMAIKYSDLLKKSLMPQD